MRKAIAVAVPLLLISMVALAQPTTTMQPPPGALQHAATGGVHINSVHVEGNCGDAARFIVEIQNNLSKVAHLGNVFVGSANSPGNRPGNPTAEFRNLAPHERRTLTLTSSWHLACDAKQGKGECFEIGIIMEPDATANGEVWDGLWHRVCAQIPVGGQKSGAVRFNDTTFRR